MLSFTTLHFIQKYKYTLLKRTYLLNYIHVQKTDQNITHGNETDFASTPKATACTTLTPQYRCHNYRILKI